MATDLESANGHDDWLYDTHDARSNVKAVIEQTAKDKAASQSGRLVSSSVAFPIASEGAAIPHHQSAGRYRDDP